MDFAIRISIQSEMFVGAKVGDLLSPKIKKKKQQWNGIVFAIVNYRYTILREKKWLPILHSAFN